MIGITNDLVNNNERVWNVIERDCVTFYKGGFAC